jgi:hypothetical protein
MLGDDKFEAICDVLREAQDQDIELGFANRFVFVLK